MERWETIWKRNPLGMPRGCGPCASHTGLVAHLSCLPTLTFKLSPTSRQQAAGLEPAIRQVTEAGDPALYQESNHSDISNTPTGTWWLPTWRLFDTFPWMPKHVACDILPFPPLCNSSLAHRTISQLSLFAIQGYIRAGYDTEIGTAQICTVSTAQIALNSTKPLTAKRQL